MAAATLDMNRKIISMHLDFMEEQRGHLHGAVDEYVDKVMDAGRKWTLSTDINHHTFSAVLNTMSKALAFLSLKCEEMKYGSLSPEVSSGLKGTDKIDDISCQNSNLSKECSVGIQFSDLTSELGRSSTQHNQELNETTKQEKRKVLKKSKTESQQESGYNDFKKQLQNLSAQQDGLDKKLNKKLRAFRNEIDGLKSDVQELNSALETGDNSVRDHSNKIKSVELMISKLSGKVDESNEALQALSEKVDESNEALQALSEKVDESNEALQALSENQKEVALNVKEVDERLSAMESTGQKDIDHRLSLIESHIIPNNMNKMEKQFEEVKINYKIVCQLLVNRLQPLEQLRHVLNERSKARDENIKQLREMVRQLSTMSDTVTRLEIHSAKQMLGFCASTDFKSGGSTMSIVHPFSYPFWCYGDDEFDRSTGMFTAPDDGIYIVNLYAFSRNSDKFRVIVHKKERAGRGPSSPPGDIFSVKDMDDASSC